MNVHLRADPISLRRACLAAAVVLMLAVAGMGTALAVHDLGLFELDGNVATTTSHDWDQVFAASPGSAPGSVKSLFVVDVSGGTTDINFASGADKDANDLNLWDWTTNPVLAKDDIRDAGVAIYTAPGTGDTIAYFFLDRFDAGTGDADVGFWFFHGFHSLVPSASDPSKGTFSGVHHVSSGPGDSGDVLVVAEFTNGGGVSTVKVFEWVGDNNGDDSSTTQPGPGAGTGPLQLRFTGVDCRNANGSPKAGGDIACATVNKVVGSEDNITPPWPYLNKDGTSVYALGALFEGGVNLTALGLDLGCGGTFLADTRASQSISARLHDFAIGDLSLCGTITIIKDTVPDGGQDFSYSTTGGLTPATFSLDDDANPTLSNTQIYTSVLPGPYTVTEAATAGFDLTGLSCTASAGSSGSGNTGTGIATITLAAGGSVTCTYVNTERAHLQLIKTVINDNGGTATASSWTTIASGPTPLSGAGGVASTPVLPGTYTLSETGSVAGYTNGTTYSCVKNGGAPVVSNSITLAPADNGVCTITNNDIPPQLHLRKVVINDNGGTATVADFTLTANGTGANDLSGTSPVDSGPTLQADTWALSETSPANYTASAWVCVGGTQNGSNISVGIGGNATCTITNNDIPPQLHLRKVVINDNGGTATVADFTLTANGTGANDLSGTSPVDSGPTLQADTWALSETGPAGYTASAWVCVGGTQSGSNITVGIGASATCTITNNDIPPQLHLRKVVINDNGGTATVADFVLTANGTGANDLSGTSPVDSGAGLLADTWALSETSPAGYTASAWVCVGGTQNGSNITVGIGGNATCTITNNDVPPGLHLRKVVINDNGGTALATDWTLSASGGPTPISGSTPVDSGAGFIAGTYALSESSIANYAASAWVCVGGTQNGSSITVGIGGSATCTITNNDIPPKLHLRKVVINDNGGTATVADFTLTANGTGTNDLSGTSPVDSGAGLLADTWALSETGPTGYTASAWVCVGGTQSGSNITVGIGGEATCTITNNDIPPKLHLRKVVINDNGGTATVADFVLTANGTGTNDLSGTSPVDSGAGLLADTWALSETGPTGYTASAWVCVGGTQSGSNITVGIGGEATCTITNNDISPTLTIVKNTVGTPTEFCFTVTGPSSPTPCITPVGNPGTGTTGPISVNAGSYVVSEQGPPTSWTMTDITCTAGIAGPDTNGDGIPNSWSFTIALAQNVTCTFTNSQSLTTRTQGFWATHTGLANAVWNGTAGAPAGSTPVIGSGDEILCGRVITAIALPGQNILMGGFWSSISKTSTGAKRTDIDQARMQMLQQYLAAVLNFHTFGSGSEAMLLAARTAYCGDDLSAIRAQIGILGAFNESGDSGIFDPGSSATSKLSKQQANIVFWDITK